MQNTTKGVSTLTVIGIVLIVLKLAKVIAWSWAWVLIPFWGPLFIALAVIVGLLLLALIAA